MLRLFDMVRLLFEVVLKLSHIVCLLIFEEMSLGIKANKKTLKVISKVENI